MYPELFGIESICAYNLIGIFGYAILFLFSFSRYSINYFAKHPSDWMLERQAKRLQQANAAPRWGSLRHWAKKELVILAVIHTVMYTFGGDILGRWIGRSTDFYGYILLTALAVALAAVTLGGSVKTRLDTLAPTFLAMASVLKLACFCAGCCYGYPWAYGWYNQNTHQRDFPIQLVEMAAYALLLVCVMVFRSRWRKGETFAFFLVTYPAIRFAVQFFRADEKPFSLFHWVSAAVCLLGIVYWLVIRFLPTHKCADSV